MGKSRLAGLLEIRLHALGWTPHLPVRLVNNYSVHHGLNPIQS